MADITNDEVIERALEALHSILYARKGQVIIVEGMKFRRVC